MADKVIDASALAAVAFSEPEKLSVLAMLDSERLFAPQLLCYEMVSICLKKIRAHPHDRRNILVAYNKSQSAAVNLLSVPGDQVIVLAKRTGLSAYDASYLWLALDLDAELVTLDARLRRVASKFS